MKDHTTPISSAPQSLQARTALEVPLRPVKRPRGRPRKDFKKLEGRRCEAMLTTGEQCDRFALKVGHYCQWHDPERREPEMLPESLKGLGLKIVRVFEKPLYDRLMRLLIATYNLDGAADQMSVHNLVIAFIKTVRRNERDLDKNLDESPYFDDQRFLDYLMKAGLNRRFRIMQGDRKNNNAVLERLFDRLAESKPIEIIPAKEVQDAELAEDGSGQILPGVRRQAGGVGGEGSGGHDVHDALAAGEGQQASEPQVPGGGVSPGAQSQETVDHTSEGWREKNRGLRSGGVSDGGGLMED